MTEPADLPPPQTPPQPIPGLREPAPSSGSGKGCFFWGCLICVILGVLFVGCAGFCVYMFYSKFKSYTSTEPIEVPVFEPAPGQVDEIQARAETFQQAEGAPGTLEISADDLNALVAGAESLNLGGKVFFRIDDDVLKAQVSLPLDEIPGFSGRYLNGELGVRPRVVNGQPALDIESARVGEQELSAAELQQASPALNSFMNTLLNDPRQQGLEEVRAFLQGVKSLDVRDGKIVIQR